MFPWAPVRDRRFKGCWRRKRVSRRVDELVPGLLLYGSVIVYGLRVPFRPRMLNSLNATPVNTEIVHGSLTLAQFVSQARRAFPFAVSKSYG